MIYLLNQRGDVHTHICGRGKVNCLCGASVTFKGDFDNNESLGSNTKFEVDGDIRVYNEDDFAVIKCNVCGNKLLKIELPMTKFDAEHINELEVQVKNAQKYIAEMHDKMANLQSRVHTLEAETEVKI